MIAIPDTDGDGTRLICDGCGDQVRGPGSTMADPDLVWPLVTGHGWTGSPFATGPHHCAGCTGTNPQAAAVEPPTRRDPAPCPCLIRAERHSGLATVLTCQGDIDLTAVPELRQAFTDALAAQPDVVLDMTEVPLIDSTGLGLLVRARQAARQAGGVLCLAAPSRFVRTVLHTMRLDGAFPVFDDTATALDWLARASGGNAEDGNGGPPTRERVRSRHRDGPAWPCTTNPAAARPTVKTDNPAGQRPAVPMEREQLR